MCQMRRWGSWIKWFTAASDNGARESNIVSDGLQRKVMEERESLKYAEGAAHSMSMDRD